LNQELLGLLGVKCIADDVLIYGRDDADHDSSLEGFMKRCQKKDIKLNRAKLDQTDNEQCQAKLEQRKQRQAQYYNRGAIDLDQLKRGDTVRMKPFQLGKREWQKGIVRKRLDERSYEVETPHNCCAWQPCSPTFDK